MHFFCLAQPDVLAPEKKEYKMIRKHLVGLVEKNNPNLEMSLIQNQTELIPKTNERQLEKDLSFINVTIDEENDTLESIVKKAKWLIKKGLEPKARIIGAFTKLKETEIKNEKIYLKELNTLLDKYMEIIEKLHSYCSWIQFEEPVLCNDFSASSKNLFFNFYRELNRNSKNSNLIMASYNGNISNNIELLSIIGFSAMHIDLNHHKDNLMEILKKFPEDKIFSAGVINEKKPTFNNFLTNVKALQEIKKVCSPFRMMISSNSPLRKNSIEKYQSWDDKLKEFYLYEQALNIKDEKILKELFDQQQIKSERRIKTA